MEVPMMTDIVKRLRDADISGHGSYSALVRDAADEIERLETKNEQWRKLNSQRVDEIAGLIHRLRADASELGRLRADNLRLVAIIARNDAEIERLRAMLRDRPRDDGTVVAVGGEPGASAGKSE
jgi:DNA-directed RNA polymerase sigma subunit (sigma70/sigma32)